MPTADRKAVFNGVKISRGKKVKGEKIWLSVIGFRLSGHRVWRIELNIKRYDCAPFKYIGVHTSEDRKLAAG